MTRPATGTSRLRFGDGVALVAAAAAVSSWELKSRWKRQRVRRWVVGSDEGASGGGRVVGSNEVAVGGGSGALDGDKRRGPRGGAGLVGAGG